MKPIFTKYHGPGYSKGSRISARDSDRNRVEISLDPIWNSEESHRQAAAKLCHKMKWYGTLVYTELVPGQYVFCWDTQWNKLHVE